MPQGPPDKRPPQTLGMHHIALHTHRLEDCLHFYTELLGMEIEWQPDADNYYLTSGSDNLALHRSAEAVDREQSQALDHLGFIMKQADDVDAWYMYLKNSGVKLLTEVKHHRDGARSFYCQDPDGNVVQMIYHPPLASAG